MGSVIYVFSLTDESDNPNIRLRGGTNFGGLKITWVFQTHWTLLSALTSKLENWSLSANSQTESFLRIASA